jgi:PKD repeat protein
MRRSPVLVAALAVLSVCAPAPAGAATTRIVDPVTGPYTTITDALHAADPGDTIDIHEGHYDEQLWIDKDDLTLRAAQGTIVSSTAPFVISLMGARDTLQGLYVAGGPGGVRIEGAGAQLIDTTVLADTTGVSIKGGIITTLTRAFVRASGLSGTALLARNDTPDQQDTDLRTSILVGGREGTGADVLTGAVGDTTKTGSASLTAVFSTIAGAPTAVRTGRDGMGALVVVTGADSIVHGAAPALVAIDTDTTTPDPQLFADPAALDFHLRADAPGIDAVPADPSLAGAVDFDGHPRVSGAAADRGAFEFADRAPTARLSTATTTARQGVSVSFDASGSSDPDPGGRVVTYNWAFGDGTFAQTAAPAITHAYSAVGTPVATVQAVDQQGATATSAPVTVTVVDAIAPVVTITAPRERAKLHRLRTVKRGKGKKARHVVNVLRFGGRATDASGIARVEVTLAQKATKKVHKPITIAARATFKGGAWSWQSSARTALPAGSYTLTVRALDGAGNTSAPAVLHFTVT